MQAHVLIFYGIQFAACLYAVRAGGLPERLVAIMMAVAALATSAVPWQSHRSFWMIEEQRVYIDVALMIGLAVLALRANRFWPIWVAALHLLAVGVHGVRAYDPAVLPIVYAKLVGWIAYPMVVVLIWGVRRHRQRVMAGGPEGDWSPLIWF